MLRPVATPAPHTWWLCSLRPDRPRRRSGCGGSRSPLRGLSLVLSLPFSLPLSPSLSLSLALSVAALQHCEGECVAVRGGSIDPLARHRRRRIPSRALTGPSPLLEDACKPQASRFVSSKTSARSDRAGTEPAGCVPTLAGPNGNAVRA